MQISNDDMERFKSSVNNCPDSGCWIWNRSKLPTGYGIFYAGRKIQTYAHRFSYSAFNGEIPEGMHVCHSCDNPSCVNPAHLWVGTANDNIRDCMAKGRDVHVVGERHGRAKLTEGDVREIRRLASTRQWGIQRRLAEKYGVGYNAIRDILSGHSWSHVK
jgi:hypothetical protein